MILPKKSSQSYLTSILAFVRQSIVESFGWHSDACLLFFPLNSEVLCILANLESV